MVQRHKKPSISTNSTASKEKKSELDWWKLEFDTDRLQFYNKTRYSHFNRLRRVISFVSLLYSSSAIYSILNHDSGLFIIISSIVMTALFLFDVVFNLSEQTAKYYDLYKQLHNLLTKIELSDNKDKSLLIEYQKEYKRIELEEPEIYRALGIWCHNQIIQARNLDKKYLYVLTPKQKIFMSFYSFPHLKLG